MTENIHKHRILILDFGSQYTQLVARRVRELALTAKCVGCDRSNRDLQSSGMILSGGPEAPPKKQPACAAVCL